MGGRIAVLERASMPVAQAASVRCAMDKKASRMLLAQAEEPARAFDGVAEDTFFVRYA
jgi:hypothetical protein